MKTSILGFSAVALVTSSTIALAANDLETTLDLAIRGMMSDGLQVHYDDKIVQDGWVEYRGVEIVNPEDELRLTTDWLRGQTNPADAAEVTFTIADTVTIEMLAEGLEKAVDFRTEGLALTTNAVLRDAMATDDVYGHLVAGRLAISDGESVVEHPVLHDLEATVDGLDLALTLSMQSQRAEGTVKFGDSDVMYDFSANAERQSAHQTSEAGEMTFGFDFADDEEQMMSGYMTGLFSAFARMTGGASTFASRIESPEVVMEISGQQGPSTFSMEVSDSVARMEGEAAGFSMDMSTEMAPSPEAMMLPPFAFSAAGMGVKLVVPLLAVDAPKEAALALRFDQLEVSEDLWAMIDPGREIPRDPAQIDLDLEALVNVDPLMAMEGASPEQFIVPHSVDINTALLAIAGAMVQASGALTFDTAAPMPMPMGQVDIEAKGVTALVNKLVGLGLLDQMQAGMVMGMIMAFGKPGPEPDQYLAQITFTEQGILANGVPMQ